MMMKNLIKTLWFILAVVWPSVVFAAPRTDHPQWTAITTAITTATIDSSNIINKACIEWAWWKKCDDVIISPYACLSISSSWTIVEIGENDQWRMRFTCEASDNTRSHSFKIDCGNWDSGYVSSQTSPYNYNCKYTNNDIWNTYNVKCYVDDLDMNNATNPACMKNIKIGNVIPLNYCWDWTLDDGEECDLWSIWTILPIQNGFIDTHHTYSELYDGVGYSCKYCKVIKDGNSWPRVFIASI